MNAAFSCRLAVIVLAAGFSSRLGRPKALVRVHGISLLRRTLTVASRLGAARVIAVIPRNGARYRLEGRGMRVTWIGNTGRAQGLSSSVRLGVAKAGCCAAALLLPADLPNLKSSELRRLIRRAHRWPRRLIARRIERSGAAPVLLPKYLYPRALRITGDVGLRELIGQLPPERRIWMDVPSAAVDIDTPDNLREARRRMWTRP